ncbi:MAG TPA: AraC family transcriptional regulator [Solibacterales bacterium]|nr:AraC family transcriptional regulator [Bryobacterales bacterium]
MSPARRFSIDDEPHLAVRSVACDYGSGTVIGRHAHAFGQLLYATSGAMSVQAAHGSWIVPPGKAVLIPAGSWHSVRMWGRVEMRSLVFPSDREGLLGAAVGGGGDARCRVISVSPLLRELILRAVELRALDVRNGPERRLLEVLADELREAATLPLELPLPAHRQARSVAQWVLARPGDPSTLDVLARRAGAGRRTIERAFRHETGLSFGLWRQKARLLHAVRLLSEGASVTDAALDTGYSSVSAFIATFRDTFGFTPGKLSAARGGDSRLRGTDSGA